MNFCVRPLILAGLLIGATTPSAQSQEAKVPLQTRQAFELPLQNVAPHLMAWWLDPTNHPRPPEVHMTPAEVHPFLPANALQPSPIVKPSGIENIIPLDYQKKLLVVGDETGVQKLRELVASLDRPQREVEFEIHVLAMRPEDVANFGLNFDLAPNQLPGLPEAFLRANRPSYATVRGALPPLLEKRRLSSRTSEIATLRVTGKQNLTTSLVVHRSHEAPPSLQNEMKYLPLGNTTPHLELHTPLEINLVPTINNDDTLTLTINLNGQLQLANVEAFDSMTIGQGSGVDAVANIKDGETLAIRGFTPSFTSAFLAPTLPEKNPSVPNIPIISEQFHPQNPLSGELMVLLTPHIVRQAQF